LLHEFRRHYFDTTSITRNPYDFKAVPYAFEAIRDMAGITHLLFGTDVPYANAVEAVQDLAALGLSRSDQLAIERDNALRLLPSLQPA
jgi:predicted TIM-barrel fold metal-dependent hydrolase